MTVPNLAALEALHHEALAIGSLGVVEIASSTMQNAVDTCGKLPENGAMTAAHADSYAASLCDLLTDSRNVSAATVRWFARRGITT